MVGRRLSLWQRVSPPLHPPDVRITKEHDLDLLLHTGGGDTDAADKLMSMARARIGTKGLRVVVPDFAKSAGTMMVLGADAVVMSDSSELGPIDPQIVRTDHNGN